MAEGDLAGRVALVTGAAQGIGAAVADELMRRGAFVVATDIVAPSAALSAGVFLHHDVTDENSWIDLVARVVRDHGGVDLLVNNAGILWTRAITDTSLADFRRMQAVNIDGVFLGMKHCIPTLAARAPGWAGGSSIVNMSSVAGIRGAALVSAYCATKGAVRLMTKAAAMEVAHLGIRVNSVHPGVIDTSMGEHLVQGYADTGVAGSIADVRAALMARHPLGRFGTVHDVAATVAFLASDAAAFTTGAELIVDGGVTAG